MEEEKKQPQIPVRKPFQKPRLHIYGHISTITQTHSPGTHSDGAANHPHRTGT